MTHEDPIHDAAGEESRGAGTHAKRGLTAADLLHLRELADAARNADGLELKLNRDLTAAEPWPPSADPDDLCHYEDGHIVGYAPLDVEGDDLEITVIVAPAYRRRGIFRELLAMARREAHRRRAKSLLLVNYPASPSGIAAVQAMRLPYVFSEYRMEAESGTIPASPPGAIHLHPVLDADVPELARLSTMSFGSERRSPDALKAELKRPGVRYYLADLAGTSIGQIGVIIMDDDIYIRGFGILPEHRRLGYGRQLLSATLQKMQAEGHTRFSLDVSTDNARALTLYESCGFHTTNIYDYHDVPLTEPAAEPS
jgi:ribosomal protein S18 acetylase RimI-like enzyme